MKTARFSLAVIAGFAAWTVPWIATGLVAEALFPDHVVRGVPLTHAGILLGFVVVSVLLSLMAGWLSVRLAGGSMKAAWSLAILLLLVGLGFEVAAWSLTPVWYHVVFLALLVPATVQGGRLAATTAVARFA